MQNVMELLGVGAYWIKQSPAYETWQKDLGSAESRLSPQTHGFMAPSFDVGSTTKIKSKASLTMWRIIPSR